MTPSAHTRTVDGPLRLVRKPPEWLYEINRNRCTKSSGIRSVRLSHQIIPGPELHHQLLRAVQGDPPFAPELATLLLGESRLSNEKAPEPIRSRSASEKS